MAQAAIYREMQAKKANLTKERLGLASWDEEDVKALQVKVGATPVDGWFGPASIEAWKVWTKKNDPNPVNSPANYQGQGQLDAGCVIIQSIAHKPLPWIKIVNFLEPNGIPAQKDDTDARKWPVFQFIIHRGAESHGKGKNYAQATEDILDARGLSTTFSMDIDGTLYQHFDPAIRRGRHATHHNVQSDSIDIGGPFSANMKPTPGQTAYTFKAAIGRENDNKPPMNRTYGMVKCWALPPAQVFALAAFLPWYCPLRGIPLRACDDMRTFRLGGAGTSDPVTNVKGILAHAQVAGPGSRVDGLLELLQIKEAGSPSIVWRSGADFFKT